MARKSRIHFPGALYHVTLRGNAGQDVFLSPEDRTRFYLLLQEGIERFGHRIHAFCLMTNHIHLVVQIAEKSLSGIMQNLSFRYTQWYNRTHNQGGHLFQGRYKAVLVDSDAYLLELVRYVNLNPVRAGMVEDPASYEWSSHRAYCGAEVIPWLRVDFVLGQFGETAEAACRAYRKFAADGLGEGRRHEFHAGGHLDCRLLGDDDFVERALSGLPKGSGKGPDLERVVNSVAGAWKADPAEKGKGRRAAEARAVVSWLAQELGGASLKAAADRFQRDPSSLSSAAHRLRLLITGSGL